MNSSITSVGPKDKSMLGGALRIAAGYVKSPLLDRARLIRRWFDRARDNQRLQKLLREQAFPPQIKHLLIVCKGNICRSPLAEAYLKHLLDRHMISVTVASAGLETSPGKPAHKLARAVGQSEGIVLESHTTQPLLKDHVDQADLIVVMEYAHRYRLLKLFPHTRDKVFLLRQFIHSREVEIADPYSGTPGDFQECFDIIRQSCDSLIKEICRVNVKK